ncbi:MAG: hypothetical protein SGI92_00860 [Bryobacteraceae bacterium]|nr:hypothetical protein [Bryobacteraceae bacterium]
MMQGLLPNEHLSFEQLEELLVDGKVCEIRMLYYVGKDLVRWLEQCSEMLSRDHDELGPLDTRTIAAFLVEDTPDPVRDKLRAWGVQDYKAIFSRAIGLNSVFGDAPTRERLSDEFIRNYHYYADQLYAAWQNAQSFSRIRPDSFEFELYASAEYSRILERQWSED